MAFLGVFMTFSYTFEGKRGRKGEEMKRMGAKEGRQGEGKRA